MAGYTITHNADGSVIIDTHLNTEGFSKGANNLKQQFSGMGAALKKFGGIVAAAFSVKEIIAFSKEAIQLGSDLQEVQNVVDVTFTTMNEQVNAFARNAVATAGLSETMAKRYVGTFGAMAKSFGFTEQQAYGMSTALTQLTGDVASFYNLSQDAAYTKLKSVFTGETETLKDLGVVMTQTALNDYAMRKGIGKTVEKMSEQEKVALRYQFVLEQLSGASGDFVRTQDSWANQTRILNLQMEQLKATIGHGLINMLTPVIKMLNTVIAKLMQFANMFKAITEALFGKASSSGAGVAETLGSAADNAEELEENTKAAGKAAQKALMGFDEINKLTEPGGGGGGSASAPAFDFALPDMSTAIAESTGDISAKLEPVIETIRSIVARIKALFDPLMTIDLSASIESIKNFFRPFASFVEEALTDLEWVWFNILVPLIKWSIEKHGPESVDLLTAAIEPLATVLRETREGWQNLITALQPAIEWIKSTASWIVGKFKERFQELGQVFKEKSGDISETLTNLGIIFSVLWQKIQPILEKIKNLFGFVFDFIGGVSSETLKNIIDAFSGLVQFVAGVLTGDWKKAINGILKMFNAMISNMLSGLNGLISALNKVRFNIPDWVPSLGGKSFGINIPKLTAPQIPYLAKGAVIPPNAPFMAMLGDQRHGTNIEAPLSTIQEAVANVMEDYSAANMAGHGATAAVLREILEAVLGIEIGDDVIANAVQRHQAKMAIVRGG
jgi:hypothetical protein